MFKLGETYYNKGGSSIRIICVDSKVKAAGGLCPIIGELTPKTATVPNSVMYYDEAGHYAALTGKDYAAHNLISNDPTEEELALIGDMSSLCRGDYSDREKEERLLKVIRALRAK